MYSVTFLEAKSPASSFPFLGVFGENSCRASHSFQWLAVPCQEPWSCGCISSISVFMFTWLSLRGSLFPNFPPLTRTPTTATGPGLSQHNLIFPLHLLRFFVQKTHRWRVGWSALQYMFGGHNASHSRGKCDSSSTTVLQRLALFPWGQIPGSGFLLGCVTWEVDGWSGVRCKPLREGSVLWLGRSGALRVSNPGGNGFPESDPESLSVGGVWDVC